MKTLKKMKKMFALMLALVMAMALSVSASAASITITNTNAGEEYTAYKLFDVTVTGEADEEGVYEGYSYTTMNSSLVSALSENGVSFTKASENLWYVIEVDATKLTSYLTDLGDSITSLLGEGKTAKVEENQESVKIDGLTSGYYFVTSTLGSLCILNTAEDDIEIGEKNEEPTVEKEVSDTDAQIGDTVTYTVTIDVPANTESLKLTDTLSMGLTLNKGSFKITIGDDTEQELSVSSVSNEDGTTTFTVDLTSYLTGEDCTIVVTYTATINENAIDDPATNEAVISYGNNSSVSSTTSTKTTPLTIEKIDSTTEEELNGAEFTLQKDTGKDDNEGNDIWEDVYVMAVYKEDGETLDYYRVATAAEIENTESSGATTTIVVDGSVTIKGLDVTATYQLIETKAPAGYNLLTTPVAVTTSTTGEGDNAVTVFGTVTVENTVGSLLPSTGGMGTTILYGVGIVLVLGAGIMLVVRRRMSVE